MRRGDVNRAGQARVVPSGLPASLSLEHRPGTSATRRNLGRANRSSGGQAVSPC